MSRISRRDFIKGAVAAGGAAALFGASKFVSNVYFTRRSQPNLFLITSDTTRADCLPFYGCAAPTMPVLSEFAANSAVFDHAYANNNVTLPAHASILTGLFPDEHGAADNWQRIPSRMPTITDYLRRSGYMCAAFVASELLDRPNGVGRSFDILDWQSPPADSPYWYFRRTGTFIHKVVEFLEQAAASAAPFFLWLHSYDPHAPYMPPSRFVAPFRTDNWPGDEEAERLGSDLDGLLGRQPHLRPDVIRAQYCGELRYWDYHLAQVLELLAHNRKLANTYMVFVADHGESLGEDELYGHYLVTEPVIHIPLFIWHPDRIAARRLATPVQQVDLAPTLLSLLGIPFNPDVFSGEDLMPLILGDAPERLDRRVFSINHCNYATTVVAPAERVKARAFAWSNAGFPEEMPAEPDALPFTDSILQAGGGLEIVERGDHVTACYQGEIRSELSVAEVLRLNLSDTPEGLLRVEATYLPVLDGQFEQHYDWSLRELPLPLPRLVPWQILPWVTRRFLKYALVFFDADGGVLWNSPWLSYRLFRGGAPIVPWRREETDRIITMDDPADPGEWGVPYRTADDPLDLFGALERFIARRRRGLEFADGEPIIAPDGAILFDPTKGYGELAPQELLVLIQPFIKWREQDPEAERMREMLKGLGYAV